MVLFLGSLTSIAIYNPGVDNQAGLPVYAEQITIVEPGRANPRVLATQPRVTAVRPLVRSRGS